MAEKIFRGDWDDMTPFEQGVWSGRGAAVVDDLRDANVSFARKPQPVAAALPAGTIRRAAFDKLSPDARAKHFRGGGRVVD